MFVHGAYPLGVPAARRPVPRPGSFAAADALG